MPKQKAKKGKKGKAKKSSSFVFLPPNLKRRPGSAVKAPLQAKPLPEWNDNTRATAYFDPALDKKLKRE